MNTSVLLLRGDRYPLSTPANSNEGATADFLRASGNRLVVILPGMTSKEQRALRGGTIKAGFLYDSGALLWLFQLYGDKGPLLTLDAPFDVRLIPADDRRLYDIENDQHRLLIDLHAIDEHKIIKVLRGLTMPPKMTVEFLSAVMDQSLMPVSGSRNPFGNTPISQLMASVETYWLGQ